MKLNFFSELNDSKIKKDYKKYYIPLITSRNEDNKLNENKTINENKTENENKTNFEENATNDEIQMKSISENRNKQDYNSISRRKSIWKHSNESWSDFTPSWRTVGESPNRNDEIKENIQNNNSNYLHLLENKAISSTYLNQKSIKTYLIEFDSGRTVLAKFHGNISVGEYVIVEADRGEDCGKVIFDDIKNDYMCEITNEFIKNDFLNNDFLNNTFQNTEFLNNTFQNNAFQNNTLDILLSNSWKTSPVKSIIRIAQKADVEKIIYKRKKEAMAIDYINHVKDVYKCDMIIKRCEYQWDDNKITFYYSSKNRVDFRELVREAFKHFKIRIWMCSESRGV